MTDILNSRLRNSSSFLNISRTILSDICLPTWSADPLSTPLGTTMVCGRNQYAFGHNFGPRTHSVRLRAQRNKVCGPTQFRLRTSFGATHRTYPTIAE
eukprot:1234976-Heterocapsa_arctica.AAC.1